MANGRVLPPGGKLFLRESAFRGYFEELRLTVWTHSGACDLDFQFVFVEGPFVLGSGRHAAAALLCDFERKIVAIHLSVRDFDLLHIAATRAATSEPAGDRDGPGQFRAAYFQRQRNGVRVSATSCLRPRPPTIEFGR